MVNSSFSSSKAKDALNDLNSNDMGKTDTFMDHAKREMEYFTDYMTGGFIQDTQFKKTVHRITDQHKNAAKAKKRKQTWRDIFSGAEPEQHEFEDEDDDEPRDPRPMIYLGIFSFIVGVGLIESFMIRSKRLKAAAPSEALDPVEEI